MSAISLIYAGAAAVVLALALLAVSGDRPLRARWTAAGLAAAFVILGFVAVAALAGRPRPVTVPGLAVREATVLSHVLREGEAIYLWLQREGEAEPLSVVLPWDQQTAEELARAAREAEENGSSVGMRFEPSLEDREPRFYALPQPAMPPKELVDPPSWYAHPGADA